MAVRSATASTSRWRTDRHRRRPVRGTTGRAAAAPRPEPAATAIAAPTGTSTGANGRLAVCLPASWSQAYRLREQGNRVSASVLIFDRDLLRRRRRRALREGAVTFLLDHVAAEFVDRLSVVKRSFQVAADIGTPTS